MKHKLTSNEKNLMRRYLVWCYKTTKESLDRVDRKFTQVKVDQFVFSQLKKSKISKVGFSQEYGNPINNFETYMNNKITEANKEKYFKNSTTLNPNYLYLMNRFDAIKKAISYFLSSAELKTIERSYEEEMTNRIWQAREHT